MANKKILLKSTSGDNLYPRTSIDNLVDTAGSTVSVSVPVLDANGKIDSSYLPSYVDDIVDLKAIASTAPSSCAKGDMYYNSASGNLKIYTATAANTWGTTGVTPETGKIYVNTADSKIYRWSGSAMVEISKQVSTVTSIRATSSALDSVVPTEKAVASSLAGKQDTLSIQSDISAAASSGMAQPPSTAAVKTYVAAEISGATAAVMEAVNDALDGKQDALTAGTNISISNGTISNTYSYSLPTATSSVLGGVKIGSNVSISSGTISVANASTSAKGVVQLATVAEATAGTLETKAVTPKGLKTELDKKQDTLTAGTNISITNGTVSCTYSYTPTYTTDIASAASSGLGQAPTTGAVKDYVTAQISGATSGVMGDVNDLLEGKQNTLTPGTNISITSGTISCTYSYSLPDASTSAKGGVKISTTASNGVALAISSGTLSVSTTAASTSAKGTVQLATTTEATTGTDSSKAVTPAGVKAALASYITYEELT